MGHAPLATGLKTLSWHHVDVEFPGVLPLAHNKICALGRSALLRWLFRDGQVIVAHQADYLLATAPTARGRGSLRQKDE